MVSSGYRRERHCARKPIQLLPVLSMMAWITLGPIILAARPDSPKRPKNYRKRALVIADEHLQADSPCYRIPAATVQPSSLDASQDEHHHRVLMKSRTLTVGVIRCLENAGEGVVVPAGRQEEDVSDDMHKPELPSMMEAYLMGPYSNHSPREGRGES